MTLFLNLYMSADTATCGTCAAQDHNVHLQENPAYDFVYPMRSKMNMYTNCEQTRIRTQGIKLTLQSNYTHYYAYRENC